MTSLKDIARVISMSNEAAHKLEGMTPARLSEQGWVLKEGNWRKNIPVPQFFETEHNDGGVPTVGEVTQDEFLNLMNELAERGISLKTILEIVNNGLYLHYNAKAKPKAITGVKAISVVFASHATPAEKLEYFTAMAESSGDEFLKNWFSKRNSAK